MSNPKLYTGGRAPGLILPTYEQARATKPTQTVRATDLFPSSGGAYERTTNLNGHGDQATFRVYTSGDPTSGLEVTIDRATGVVADDSNGVVVTFTSGALDATFSAADKTLEIEALNSTNLGALRAELNGITGLSAPTTAFFGSGAAADAWDRGTADTVTTGGRRDRWSIFRVQIQPNTSSGANGAARHAGNIYLGDAVPSNDAGSEIMTEEPYIGVLPPGDDIWLRSSQTTDRTGSVALWVVEP